MNNNKMVSELLPCPFCGQQDFLIERLDSDASVVICQGLTGPHEACLARGPVGVAQDEGEEQPGRDKAVELWNARAEQHQGEPVAWSAVKPVSPGAYWIRGNGLDQEALVQVINDGELRCNLHQRTTEADFDWGYAVSDLSPEFEWLGPLYPHFDPGEVELLRAERDQLQADLTARDERLDSVDEGASILRSLIENIETKGNYSPESTVSFISQALGCIALAPTVDYVSISPHGRLNGIPPEPCSGCGTPGWTGNCPQCIPY